MSDTPKKSTRKQNVTSDQYKTPQKGTREPGRDIVSTSGEEEPVEQAHSLRKSNRKKSPSKRYSEVVFAIESPGKKIKTKPPKEITDDEDEESYDDIPKVEVPKEGQLFDEDLDVDGKRLYGFHTPKKRDALALAAAAVPKTPKTPKTPKASAKTPDAKRNKAVLEPKTPRHVRKKVKNQIAKLLEDGSNSDFSNDESEYKPSDSSSSSSPDADDDSQPEDDEDEDGVSRKSRQPVIIPELPKTPSSRSRRPAHKAAEEFVPESDSYFTAHSSKKIMTSDHTLDRLKNPRLPADQLFSLLDSMTISKEHEDAIAGMIEEYKTYFRKWLFILNEGFNIVLYGLGSKRNLLQQFHQDALSKQNVLVVNGFFPSLTLKEILDSITNEILEIGPSPANPHEAVDVIEEEFKIIPEMHMYLLIHNIDGPMLRNPKAQDILSRLAKLENIHLVASIDHINTPLLWDQTKLSNFNFSWWDVTTMLPYTDETAFENSLLVQNSGELALSSMRSVFSSLTTNARGIYMMIVKYQLKNKGNPNYQGMPFKDLYWSCREAFLVSSDLALRAQLTEFLDHKLVKSKRSIDGSEQLQIPIETGLLQQFLDEQPK